VAADCVRGFLDAYAARLDLSLAADRFDVQTYPQALQVELDLDAAGPVQATSTFVEGFESGLGNFAFMNLDANRASNSASDGYRCQYNDPDYVNSNSYGDTECYLGFAAGQAVINDWHAHTTTMSGGRAYVGTRSLHYGRHDGGVDTLPLSQLDAVRTLVNVNLAARVCRDDPAPGRRACNTAADCLAVGGGPCVSAVPQLSFKHQLGAYARYPGRPTDRAIVQAQVVGSATWEKIFPYLNVYTGQASDIYSNCTFDPVDDGNDEDDYFDPADPGRRFGPSSTCFPEFVFDALGDTGEPFQPDNIRNASDGPGLQGSLGIGTWVESRFDLSRFRGRSVRLRFLFTSIKVSDLATYQSLFMWNPVPDDDGWYVDDVRVTETLGTALATVGLDGTDNSNLPSCPSAPCSAIAPSFSLEPPSGALPGRPVTLSAEGSQADRCSNGALLFRFFEDRDASGTYSPGDLELAPFATSPVYTTSPTTATRYGVTVRCSAGGTGSCLGADATAGFSLTCAPPPPVYDPALWWTKLRMPTRTTLSVPPHGEILDVVRGDLGALRASGTYAGSTPVCLVNDGTSTSLQDVAVPARGEGFYYLLRGQRICNDNQGYRTYAPRENPADPAKRDTELLACPP
jgi:hypothetical protein